MLCVGWEAARYAMQTLGMIWLQVVKCDTAPQRKLSAGYFFLFLWSVHVLPSLPHTVSYITAFLKEAEIIE